MKILLIHNYYGRSSPSGENSVVEIEINMLKENGHNVVLYSVESDPYRRFGVAGGILASILMIWNPFTYLKLKRLIGREKPDLIHIHNTFPILSPSVFYAAYSSCPVVYTLHNYRLLCPGGIPYLNNLPCNLCFDKRVPYPAIINRCYRQSYFATIPIFIVNTIYRRAKLWAEKIDKLVVLSSAQREIFFNSGIGSERNLWIKPNFYNSPIVDTDSLRNSVSERQYCLYVGRLCREKGFHTLLKAWETYGRDDVDLMVAGSLVDNNDSDLLNYQKNIKYLGQLKRDKLMNVILGAKFIVVPSECMETFGMVVCEAASLKVPALVAEIGALEDLVIDGKTGLKFKAGDAQNLKSKLQEMFEVDTTAMGASAFANFCEKYNGDVGYFNLLKLYSAAISNYKNRIGI